MNLAEVSARRIEDVGKILWNAGMSAGTVSNLNEKKFGSATSGGTGRRPTPIPTSTSTAFT